MPILIIGLDGATFAVLQPWLADGTLPTLARLSATGTTGELLSTLPPVTAPAWVSFMTGKNPGQHGIFDFFRPHAANLDRFEMVNASHIRSRLFWEYLPEKSLRVGILNIPVTHPPRPVNGYIVPGLLSPDQGQTCYPPGLLQPYQAELGPYRLTPDLLYKPDNAAAFIADLHALIDTQSHYAQRLIADHPADLQIVHFLAPDIAQHKLWRYHDPTHPWYTAATPYGSALRDLYVRLDQSIAALIALMPPETTVFVMSDHGFGPHHQIVNLNQFFIHTGLMVLQRGWRVRARQWAFGQPWLWPWVARWLRPLAFADVDWSQTVAYSLGHMGQIYLNVAGRQPYGIVAPQEYAAAREQVVTQLHQLRHPVTQQPLVEKIIPGDAAATGPYQNQGPDLHVVMNGYQAVAYPMFAADGQIVTEQRHGNSGDHRAEGIFIASGPAIRSGHTLTPAHITDLAPTILYLLGVPIPDDMDGQVLLAAIEPAYQDSHPVQTLAVTPLTKESTSLSQQEQAIVAERLRDLGYLG